jgi:menaquinol-cytochrome c reductase cytochrome b/c subunit
MTDIPDHLRQRAEDARYRAQEGDTLTDSLGSGDLAVDGGTDERLLSVIRAGSIQELRTQPTDKVNVWPHLLVVEFVAALCVFTFVTLFSIFMNAPLQELANPNKTPNPAKAPWYFVGLQELLTYFNPMVAGVLGPGMAAAGLIVLPYLDKNPSTRPEDRKFAVSFYTIFLMFWGVLGIIGAVFRGKGFQFTLPWKDGLFFDL